MGQGGGLGDIYRSQNEGGLGAWPGSGGGGGRKGRFLIYCGNSLADGRFGWKPSGEPEGEGDSKNGFVEA